MSYAKKIAEQIGVREEQIAAAIELLAAENTVPFIARYRKEVTGGLDEEQLRNAKDVLSRLRALDERRATVLKTIEEQGNLTAELEQKILAAETLTVLEDLYQPYKPKRKTRASVAREKGLEPLADLIIRQNQVQKDLDELAAPYLNDQVTSSEEAWEGARDIVAEQISDHSDVRREIREKALHWGMIQCQKIEGADDPRATYKLYYDNEYRIDKLRPHQLLAINRGEKDKVLRVKANVPERDWRGAIALHFTIDPRSPLADQLRMAIEDAANRLLLPAIERDIRRALTESAEEHAIQVFAENLRALISQPPITGHTVMGIDPGFRTGCKVSIVDPTGKVLTTNTIYPHEPQKAWDQALTTLDEMVEKHAVTLVAIGNGTASRETEQLIAEMIRIRPQVRYIITNEAGASVYSASPLARAELPDLDVSMRSAVSIARRVQDPLAELVKIEPKSIGVGLYQHDVDQKRLEESLSGIVESVVNQVGVDANTASPALLTYVAGIGPKIAQRMVAFRDEKGPFANRNDLMSVPGLGPKAFQQAAGFLRVRGSDHPLDASAIHPESYHVAEAILERSGMSFAMGISERKNCIDVLIASYSMEQLAAQLDTGVLTLTDIFEHLVRPDRDPREELPPPILRADIVKAEDLAVGIRLRGTVRNVVDFGAFIDIGVKQDGLLHRSKIPPSVSLAVGDIIQVEIISIELERGRIGLKYINVGDS